MLLDLTHDALEWLELPPGPERVAAFVRYERRCEPWSLATRSSAGTPAGVITPWLAKAPAEDAARLTAFIRSGVAEGEARKAIAAVARVTDLTPPRVVLLVGHAGSNALQVRHRGESTAIACVESFAGIPAPARCPAGEMHAWLCHEMAHALRCDLAGTASPCALYDGDAAGFIAFEDALPMAERVVDEGLATALALEASEVARDRALGMSPEQVAWLDAQRQEAWMSRLLEIEPDTEEYERALYLVVEDEPWSAEHPPSRWAYHAGLAIAQRARVAGMTWRELLTCDAGELIARLGPDRRA
jgi:hypothetical protein